MNKHILLSTKDPGVGGVAQYNHSLLCGLVKLGYRITCLQPQAFNDRLIIYQKYLGIEHLWTKDIIKNWIHLLIKPGNKPDLIICSNTNPFANLGIKRIAILLNIPYVIVEGLVEPHLASQNAICLNELSHQYMKAHSVIAVSFDNLNLLHKLFKLPKDKGQVIYYGRPSEYFTVCNSFLRDKLRQSCNIPSDAVVCFTAARLENRKGYQYQLEAIKQLIYSPIWSQLYFVWAGGGIFNPQLETELQEIVNQLGINNKVIFLGQRIDVVDWLNTADIFVFPSLLEGMPLCVMEAMAKGLPVIASAVSGIPEELGDTGKLLTDPKIDPQATVRELVTTIEDWVSYPSLRESIGQICKQRAEKMFKEERMIQETVEVIEQVLLSNRDYVSPGFQLIQPDKAFPNLIVGNTKTCKWPYLRREIAHNWYVDKCQPTIGFLSRDEAHILYNTALNFKGKKALEIGCWLGWSACHMALAGVELDVIDPLLNREDIYESVSNSLQHAGVLDSVNLICGYSPNKVQELAKKLQCKWSLIFIDGDHEAPGPLNDAIICEQLAEADALILFHDLNSPDVAQGLNYFKQKGWNTMVYQTMQIMGVAWRGNVEPVQHQSDPTINWKLPKHLQHYSVSGSFT
ncbi:glycosyltransferase [Nostoc sp.]|uniref:glycosyltransferase n=1 Tax=Nostoc sp. TaxID=1180 RepID=UPI002FF8038F